MRLVTEYLAYGGRWSIAGNTVTPEVTLSLNPTLLDTRQMREVSFVGAELVLSAIEPDGAHERTRRLRWCRP